MKSDKYAEAKAILAAMISAGAGAFPETTKLISPLGGATQLNNGGIDSAFSAGLQAGGQLYSKRLLERLDKDPFYVRVPAGTTFYLYVTQTVDLGKATVGLSASVPPPTNPTQPMKSSTPLSCSAFSPGAPRGRKSGQSGRWKFPAQRLRRQKCRKSARRKR